MRFNDRRSGSALLIVLGMLSFMVVSAVAFSMYMRQSRLPSSFLRQRVAAGELVKAALARSMDRLDRAVRDNPYPGVGTSGEMNYWKNRVLIGDKDSYDEYAADDSAVNEDAVATLPLEGLAYLPPPLMNTVRYWSRRTPTAEWDDLGYDAGRYAFTAVNVSDYFDLNRIKANVMRDSSPSNRITIAYLFENEEHTDWSSSPSPKDFDKCLEKTMDEERLVSMADYNLSLHAGALSGTGFKSPFCEYFSSGSGDGAMYGQYEENAKRQKFVTDSWYPGSLTNSADTIYLTDGDAQLFADFDGSLDGLQKESKNQIVEKKLVPKLNLCELAALEDYLDNDSVPVSLAVPTLERTPMLTGINVKLTGVKPEFTPQEETEPIKDSAGKVISNRIRKSWKINNLGDDPQLKIDLSAVYPFARSSGLTDQPSSFEVEVLAKVFLCRTIHAETFKSCRTDVDYFGKDGKDFRNEWNTKGASNAIAAQDKGCATLVGKTTFKIPSSILEEKDALIDAPDVVEISMADVKFEDKYVFAITYEEGKEEDAVYDASNEHLADEKNLLRYRTPTGEILPLKRGTEDLEFRLAVMTWVRIKDKDGKTVDLVPARVKDDKLLNDLADMELDNELLCGSRTPVLPLVTEPIMRLNLETFKDNGGKIDQEKDQENLTIYCSDPRYNFAPEDWFKVDDATDVSGEEWLTKVKAKLDGSGFRGSDIFQFVSDCEILQSVGELQNLPLVRTGFQDFSGDQWSGTYFRSAKYNGKFAEGIESLANAAFMWKNWWQFGPCDTEVPDEYNLWKWGIEDSRGGIAVNPYSDTDLLMAAFANTPYDWIVACPPDTDAEATDEDFKLCFGPRSDEANIEWKDLKTIAETIKSKIKQSPTTWESEWFDWDEWYADSFFGVDLGETFHDVDRRFLFSYWKGCLANRQQLYLIFVRAEPAMMGGGSGNATPSQLGARAVALVWREPVSTIDAAKGSSDEEGTFTPHRMRILFYHQFD